MGLNPARRRSGSRSIDGGSKVKHEEGLDTPQPGGLSPHKGTGRRTLRAAGWQTWIGLVRLLVGLVRFVVLARLLPIEVFGQFGLAAAMVGLTIVVPRFGLTAAFLHRSPHTREEEPAASVLFTLRFGLVLGWAACLSVFVLVTGDGAVRTAVWVLVCCQLLAEPAFVPRLLLIRRLSYARIAVQESLSTVIGSVAAILLAFSGAGLWALLAPSLCHAVIDCVVFYWPSPVWRPRVACDRETAGYFLGFGSRNLLNGVFDVVIDKLPELWIGVFLGTSPLGIYSRASRLASYPRRVATDPLVSVLPARFSELKDRPSEFASVLRASLITLMVGAAMISGAVWVLAPWLIEDVMGAKWLPALTPFRIVIALVVLEPLRLTLNCSLVARGEPGRAARIRGIQAVLLAPAVVVAASVAGLAGVAGAVVASAMLCVALLAFEVRRLGPLSAAAATGQP